MSFQSLIETIFNQTGKTPEEIAKLATEKGLFEPDVKPGAVVNWLKQEFTLGQGHSMALFGLFKSMGLVKASEIKPKPQKQKYISRKSQ